MSGAEPTADNISAKPIVARKRAVRDRMSSYQVGDRCKMPASNSLVLDLVNRLVLIDGDAIKLTPREIDLLGLLAMNANRVVTRSMLLEQVWRYHPASQTNAIDVCVGNLRRKLRTTGKPDLIRNIRGLGFQLALDERERSRT